MTLNSEDVLAALFSLFIERGAPGYIMPDTGPEFTAKAARQWLPNLGAKALYIEPGSSWEMVTIVALMISFVMSF